MVIPVKTSTGEYNIFLEKNSLNKAGELINLNRRVLIVTDSGVPEKYSKTLSKQCKEPHIVTINQGEGSKCFDVYKFLLEQMVKFGFTRTDCVAAVGGGVVGDISGFVASTFMRGVDFYNIPTTVLSQVDSSIGGKVAVDFCGFKNIVGAFYPPKAVIIDSETLSTLPERQISNGLAESVKMAVTCDKDLFEYIEKGDFDLEKVIENSLKIKRFVVEQDEKEGGLRKILNFGHTLAHAIESENNMENLYHGECVALGMIPMCGEDIRGRIVKVLCNLNLPVKCDFDFEKIVSAVKHDKKINGDEITVIVSSKIGEWEMKKMPVEQYITKLREVLR